MREDGGIAIMVNGKIDLSIPDGWESGGDCILTRLVSGYRCLVIEDLDSVLCFITDTLYGTLVYQGRFENSKTVFDFCETLDYSMFCSVRGCDEM